MFEEYIHGQFREFCSESEILVRDFYASPKPAHHGRGWRRHHPPRGHRPADGVQGPPAHHGEKFGGVREVTLKGIDDILYRDKKGGNKGVAQLAKNLARILRGERIAAGAGEGLDLSGCKHLFPVIVAYEEAVALEAVRQEAEAKLRQALAKSARPPTASGRCWCER
jgi:hypothetical protein